MYENPRKTRSHSQHGGDEESPRGAACAGGQRGERRHVAVSSQMEVKVTLHSEAGVQVGAGAAAPPQATQVAFRKSRIEIYLAAKQTTKKTYACFSHSSKTYFRVTFDLFSSVHQSV